MLQRLSPRTELLLILLICFGPFAVRSAVGVVERSTVIVFDDARALTLLGTELVAGAVAFVILRARQWTLADFGLRPTIRQTIGGMLLLIGSNLVIALLYESVRAATGTDPGAATESKAALTWPVLIALTLVNPLYDELLAVAYIIRASETNGAAFAITLSAMVRFLCHLEQGPVAAVTILPLGLMFAILYWRTRLLWPLVVAHAVMDFLGLMPRTL
jgi:membrane protease YdiL (CAAX protease family)